VAVVTTDSIPAFIDQFATGETTLAGVLSGSAADTHADDGVSESIGEVESGGSPAQSYSYLEHYWSFDVAPGEAITVYVDVDTDASGQAFTFAYATTLATLAQDPGAWIDMFTVDGGNPGVHQFTLPATLTGLVTISVRDTVRTAGSTSADQVHIDYMAIRTSNPTGLPPGC